MNLSKTFINKFEERKFFIIVFLSCLILRIIISYNFGDKVLEYEWRTLVKNLYYNETFAMRNFGELYVPSIWMPPVYGFFIYLHALFFGFNENLPYYVIATQTFISSLTPIVFYKLLSLYFSKFLSALGSIIFGFFPLIVFASSQISSVTLFLFLLLCFIYLILVLKNKSSIKEVFLIGFIAGILLLTRRDFLLIYLISITYAFFFFKIKIRKLVLIFLISFLTISPYIIRNYIAFDKIIMHTGLGYNLWKAYNLNAKIEGGYEEPKNLITKLRSVKKNIFFRINEDEIYLNEAIKFIQDNPKKVINLFLDRMIAFYFYDWESTQKNYFNFFHLFPNLIIAVISLFGISVYNKKSKTLNYFFLLMLLIIFVYSVFALLPRYKTYIIPFQIIFSLSAIQYLIKKN